MSVKIRTAFDAVPDYSLVCEDESLTKQCFSDECDFARVIQRWQSTGQLEHMNPLPPQYSDVSEIPDYLSALNTVVEAEASFMSLPSTLRDRFDNDPAKFLGFVSDDANRDEAVKLGLVVDKAAAAPSGQAEALPTTKEA